jgi:hypothetical protein
LGVGELQLVFSFLAGHGGEEGLEDEQVDAVFLPLSGRGGEGRWMRRSTPSATLWCGVFSPPEAADAGYCSFSFLVFVANRKWILVASSVGDLAAAW